MCKTEFSLVKTGAGRFPRFCSQECRAARSANKAKRYAAEKALFRTDKGHIAKAEPKPFTCQECGGVGLTKQANAKYCSKECTAKGVSKVNSSARPWKICPTCGEEFKPCRPNRKQVDDGYEQVHCSHKCAGMAPRKKEAKRSMQETELRKRRKWGKFDPSLVFERDGWRCHICGRKTPKRLRGSTDDRAPELDHIVTIADGGEHSERNTSCACRRCNRHKGAKSMGQMFLF